MLASDIRFVESNSYCELQGDIVSPALRPFKLWYRFPATYKGSPSFPNGDPFIPALLLPAMRTGEALEISSPVSPMLLDSVGEIQALYRSWDPSLSRIDVKAPYKADIPLTSPRREIGLFFSLGVDSYYSLFKNQMNHAHDQETISHLIVVHGFDVNLENSELSQKVLGICETVAQITGKRVLPVATNIRSLGDRFAEWGSLYFGAALASVGLCFEHMFSRICIAASVSDGKGKWEVGSHPDLDYRWSTDSLTFLHDGCEPRVDKIRFVAQFPIVLETLRVCWKNPHNQYNCGRCEKCVRTMIGLHIAGALQKSKTFPPSLDLRVVKSIRMQGENERIFARELISSLSSSAIDLGLKSALEVALRSSTNTLAKLRNRILRFRDLWIGFILQVLDHIRARH